MKVCNFEPCAQNGSNMCCFFCPEKEACDSPCDKHPDSCGHCGTVETDLAAFETQYMTVFEQIKRVVESKKAMEAQEKELKDKLREAMEAEEYVPMYGAAAQQEKADAAERNEAQCADDESNNENQEKKVKDKLREAMEAHGIKSIDNQLVKITYVAPTTAISIDSAKLKKRYPAIAEECSKSSPKAGYIKIEVKE